MASKDTDTALWLHNKLGSVSQLWNNNCYTNVVSHYSIDRLIATKECFQNLDSFVKIKFFLSLFYIPKRNYEEVYKK